MHNLRNDKLLASLAEFAQVVVPCNLIQPSLCATDLMQRLVGVGDVNRVRVNQHFLCSTKSVGHVIQS
jgi:hypothetical protein